MDGIRQSPIHRGSETASACAGNTRHSQYAKPYPRNYLRVRGECKSSLKSSAPSQELPPRTRRIPGGRSRCPRWFGTTSAYAENTRSGGKMWFQDWNYLRVRGEYNPPKGGEVGKMELPPRTRRIPGVASWCLAGVGTTSAYAENTSGTGTCPPWVRNYLRVRGEYRKKWLTAKSSMELPPRTRRIQTRAPHIYY